MNGFFFVSFLYLDYGIPADPIQDSFQTFKHDTRLHSLLGSNRAKVKVCSTLSTVNAWGWWGRIRDPPVGQTVNVDLELRPPKKPWDFPFICNFIVMFTLTNCVSTKTKKLLRTYVPQPTNGWVQKIREPKVDRRVSELPAHAR